MERAQRVLKREDKQAWNNQAHLLWLSIEVIYTRQRFRKCEVTASLEALSKEEFEFMIKGKGSILRVRN
jgi:hypothetical protein